MWYLWAMIGCAVLCLGIPLFLVYWTDKKKRKEFQKKNKKSEDMSDLDHY